MDMKILLILFVKIGLISAAEWGSPVFSRPDDFPCRSVENCPYWKFNPNDSARTVYIQFDEEKDEPIIIAHINCKNCSLKDLAIGKFTYGSKSLLGPELKEIEGKYSLIVNNKLDYESIEQREFRFDIVLEGALEYRVKINLQDIDDNPPRIIVHDTPCIIPENYPGKTNCTYSIYDPDTINKVDKIKFIIPDDVKKYFSMELNKINDTNAESILLVNEGKDNQLDFETMPVYYFEITAVDGGGNEGNAQIMIKVKDVNDQPPVWVDVFAMKSFEENTKQAFTVYAKDGDVEVNDKIDYTINCDICNDLIKIVPNEDGIKANILVDAINREAPEVEKHGNTLKCTLVASDPLYDEPSEINFIIQDVNDNAPIITLNEKLTFPIELREEEFITLEELFSVDDKDEGNNAQFDVILENEEGAKINYTKPFQVIPNNGYRNWKFSVSVIEPELLDYDRTPHWREFSLKIHSQDKGTNPESMHDEKVINIKLKNLNDEIPEFDTSTNYELKIREDINASAYILNVLATDADEGDKVIYDLSSGQSDFDLIRQDNDSVTIYTAGNGVFDYEKNKLVYIQIVAQDTLVIDGESNLHTVTQQIKVEVIDVNDEKPRLTLPSKTPKIQEHSDIGTEVTSEIKAADVDTEAELEFFIIWTECRASKLGVPVENLSLYENVFSIQAKYPDGNKGSADGVLKVNNNKNLDYEVFDTILLHVQVKDQKQEMGDGIDAGMMTILLLDINDNAPEFNMETINSNKTVTEHSKSNLKIATITATDVDGIGNNNITYYLEPVGDTKPDLVKILPKSGELLVDKNELIDADEPDCTEYLYYKIIAGDSVFNTTEQIAIYIEDINDMKPYLKTALKDNVTIKERESTDKKECIQYIDGHDKDRDYPHNHVSYYLNNELSSLSQKYEVDIETGEVCAIGKIEWKIGQEIDKIYVALEDNIGGRSPNIEKFNFTVLIEDIDNYDPILPEDITIKNPPIREDIEIGTIVAEIIATDEDKPCTQNTEIDYAVQDEPNSKQTFFKIEKIAGPEPKCDQIGVLKTNVPLQDHYGKITVTIRAKNPRKTKYDEKSYDIIVQPYNFRPPKIIYPSDADSTLILLEDQPVGEHLIGIDENKLKDFEASDDQNGKFKMQFEISDPWDTTFALKQLEDNLARLILTKKPTAKQYELKFKAFHDGDGSASNVVEQTIIVKFVDKDQLPSFKKDEQVKFEEETMTPRCQPITKADDPKCFNDEDCTFVTYYHIMNNEEKVNFEFDISDKNKPEICLLRKLDREVQAYHYLTIVATNFKVPPVQIPNEYNPLNLTVIVTDINDNPPVFDSKLFKGGLADSDKIDSIIVTLKATDPDEVDEGKLRYRINENTITVSDSSLDDIKNKAFKLENDEIRNLFQPSQQMQGFFSFKVQVFDTLDFNDTAEVKIHIVSDANRVTFRFEEDIDEVKAKTDQIEEVFTKEFDYFCTIDDFAKKVNETSKSIKASGFITEVKTHFVDSKDDPIEKEKITVKLDDLATIGRLKIRLGDVGVTLIYVDALNDAMDEAEDMNYLLKILLIVVSVVLGTLCLILIVAFILRTRSLQKRMEAMTTNVFGSTKSDLNRIGTSAPGTNRHAIEANPVWNEDLNSVNQFDTMSQASGGSDLIGIENRPEFAYDIRDDLETSIPYGRFEHGINPTVRQRISENNDNNINGQKFSSDDDDDDIESLPGLNNNSTMF